MKNVFLLIIGIFIFSNSFAKKIIISGYVTEPTEGKVFLYNIKKGKSKLIDSTTIIRRNFSFKIWLNEKEYYYLVCNTIPGVITFVTNKSIRIELKDNSFNDAIIFNSIESKIFNQYNDLAKKIGFSWIRENENLQKCIQANDSIGVKDISKSLDSLKEANRKLEISIIEKHPKTYTALYILNKIYLDISLENFKFYLNLLKPSSSKHSIFITLKEKYTLLCKTKVGAVAPPFALKNIDDFDSIQLSEISKQYILLDFWGSWCGPCIKAIPDLTRIYKRFNGTNFEIISVAYDEIKNKPQLDSLIALYKMNWLHGFVNMSEKNNLIISQYSVMAFPTYILIGPDRKILFRDNGKGNFEILEKILKDKLN